MTELKVELDLAKEIEAVITRASYFLAEATDYVPHPNGKRYLEELSEAAIKSGDELSDLIAKEAGDAVSAVRADLLGRLRRTRVRNNGPVRNSARMRRSLIRSILETLDRKCEELDQLDSKHKSKDSANRASDTLSFNINRIVRVKLTDHGRRVHRQNFDAFYSEEEKRPVGVEYHPPQEDSEGWSSWPLWRLMEEFGGHHYGAFGPFCFEPNIEIDLSDNWLTGTW